MCFCNNIHRISLIGNVYLVTGSTVRTFLIIHLIDLIYFNCRIPSDTICPFIAALWKSRMKERAKAPGGWSTQKVEKEAKLQDDGPCQWITASTSKEPEDVPPRRKPHCRQLKTAALRAPPVSPNGQEVPRPVAATSWTPGQISGPGPIPTPARSAAVCLQSWPTWSWMRCLMTTHHSLQCCTPAQAACPRPRDPQGSLTWQVPWTSTMGFPTTWWMTF